MPAITIKNLKVHEECVCGLNIVDDYKEKVSKRILLRLGYKKRKYRDTGEEFYFSYNLSTECNCDHLL